MSTTRRGRGAPLTVVTPTDPNLPIWVRPHQACELTGLGLTSIYALMKNGHLESRKLGKARLIRRSSLDNIQNLDSIQGKVEP